jgi:hypothetical protein
MDARDVIESGVSAALFATVFLAGARVHPLRAFFPDRRITVSFGAGISVAYVFVHVMPELHGARLALVESVSVPLPYEGMAVYVLSLVGFLIFYGLEHLRQRLHGESASRIHVSGFAVYVVLVGYLLVRNLEHSAVSMTAYAVAMSGHFLTVDHSLREQHRARFDRVGRFVLAGAALLGWGLGLLVALPPYTLALLLAFVSGAVIMNSAIMELPAEKDGRFWPFVIGGLAYGLLLLLLG